MNIKDFFNPYNVDHLKAYIHLNETGFWPKGFIPEGMEFDSFWQILIAIKMANAWLNAAQNGHIIGMSHFNQ
jgi:hypothetical protein